MTEENYPVPADTSRVSIIIKALNEEKRIARSIESALNALERLGGEVILADSCSTDQTIEIAKRYPIKIVQLANPAERCCGIGPQLGYQHSKGEYVYILDGDMELRPEFIERAVQFLVTHPKIAGVGGRVVEHNLDSMEYRARVERNAHHMGAGPADRLDMGGLYRRAAIEDVGYFSDRNLHSYEELDLGVRLQSRNWALERIDANAVDHYGHDISAYTLLKKRWRSRYINGIGEVLRAAFGTPHLRILMSRLKEIKLYLFMFLYFLCLILSGAIILIFEDVNKLSIFLGFFILFGIPFVGLFFRKRSLPSAAYAYISLIFHIAGLFRGVFSRRKSPFEYVKSLTICSIREL
jgi:glycosyltransferase involved in cell wall biosynthesis